MTRKSKIILLVSVIALAALACEGGSTGQRTVQRAETFSCIVWLDDGTYRTGKQYCSLQIGDVVSSNN